MQRPDQPLVYVNAAFEAARRLPAAEVLGRNCRFLQSPDTDPAAVARIRAAIDRGEECRETVLNLRGPDRTPWWNEIHLAPVLDDAGTVVRYIGVQHDVTARVEAERALLRERDRNQQFLARIEELANTDPLTGLPNRRRLEEQVQTAIWSARGRRRTPWRCCSSTSTGSRRSTTRLGHAAGDELLQAVARTLRGRLRRSDLLARLGGDEFLVALTGLDPATAATEARRVADELTAAVATPVDAARAGRSPSVRASGVAVYPADGEEFEALLHSADAGMYAHKAGGSAPRAELRRRRAVQEFDREGRRADTGQPGVAPGIGLGGRRPARSRAGVVTENGVRGASGASTRRSRPRARRADRSGRPTRRGRGGRRPLDQDGYLAFVALPRAPAQPRRGGSRVARPPWARAVSCSTSSGAGTLRSVDHQCEASWTMPTTP